MKKLIYTFAFIAIFLASCSNDETTNSEKSTELTSEEVSSGLGEGLKSLNIDFTKPVVYNYSTLSERDSIINVIITDLSEVELHSFTDDQGRLISDEFVTNLLINQDSKTITVQPEPIVQVIVVSSDGDDNEKCGGKEGDGWKSHGVCTSEQCVKDKSAEAAASYTLVSGKCLDIRIKRNTFNARVCARLVNC